MTITAGRVLLPVAVTLVRTLLPVAITLPLPVGGRLQKYPLWRCDSKTQTHSLGLLVGG
jgi:hypothetical protein